jgi:hypothetical protein
LDDLTLDEAPWKVLLGELHLELECVLALCDVWRVELAELEFLV